MEDLKVLGEGGGAGLDGAGAASNRAGDRLLPADFDTARPRPNIVLIMCDDQGTTGKVELRGTHGLL